MKINIHILVFVLSFIAFVGCAAKKGSDPKTPTYNETDTTQTPWTHSTPWPFEMPSKESLRAYDKKVYAHYFTQFPISIDNKPGQQDYYTTGYLSPNGENGKHAGYGGFLRNRPLPRSVISGADWEDTDMEEEVRRAIEIGLDGFICDLLSEQGYHLERTRRLLETADRLDKGFRIMLMPDMEAFKTKVDEIAPLVSDLSHYPAALRLEDGRLVVSPYNAQVKDAGWWKDWIELMRTEYGIDVALLPLFQGWRSYADQFKDISFGMSDWGWRSPKANAQWLNVPDAAHVYTDVWMMPVAPQDMRPYGPVYTEAANSDEYRVMWDNSIRGGADWVQLITWNDYSEHASMAPSTGTQHSFFDLTAYYLTWFKTGTQPEITRDALYYFYRRHSTATTGSSQSKPFVLASGSDPAQNMVEVLAFLTEPGVLEIQIGKSRWTQEAPAGITSFKVAIQPGYPVFRLYRNDKAEIILPGVFEIKNNVKYQDLLYYGGSNTRPQNAYSELLYKID